LKARILLKADVSEAGKGWSDNRIIEALETSPSMVYRVRKQLVEEVEMQRFAPHSGRLQASQFWLSPMTCSAKTSCVLSPSPVETPPASQFLPRNSMASDRKSSLRRCPEFAVSQRLRIAMSACRHGCGRSKMTRAHAASSFQSTRLPGARKLGAPSTRRKR